MAATIDATPGGTDANSYATVAEADAYFEGRLHVSAWDAATSDTKTRALIQATGWLDQYDYRGERLVPAQALKWPRAFVYDEDGYELPVSEIPAPVRRATFEAALALLAGDPFASSGLDGFDEARVGPLAVKVRRGARAAKLPDVVENLLSRWIIGGGMTGILRRA